MIKRTENIADLMHQVVEHNDTLYLAGVVANDFSVGMQAQTEQALQNLQDILVRHGSGKQNLLTATIYISDMALKEEMNVAWRAWIGGADLPARATIAGADLGENVLIEIVTIAAKG